MADDAKKPGGGGIVLPLIILTLIGGGLGVGAKLFLFSDGAPKDVVASEQTAGAGAENKGDHAEAGDGHGEAKAEAHGEGKPDANGEENAANGDINKIVSLDPIVASLAKSSGAWVRLETALVFRKTPDSGFGVIKSEISGDILAYLRTVSLDQIQGAAGLEYLTDDLQDIARVRSQGAVDRLVIKGLIFE